MTETTLFLARVSSGSAPVVYPLRDPRCVVFSAEYPTKSRGRYVDLQPKAWVYPTPALRTMRPLCVGAAAIDSSPAAAIRAAWEALRAATKAQK